MGLTCHYFIICVLPLPEDAIYALSRSNNPTRVLRSQLKKKPNIGKQQHFRNIVFLVVTLRLLSGALAFFR